MEEVFKRDIVRINNKLLESINTIIQCAGIIKECIEPKEFIGVVLWQEEEYDWTEKYNAIARYLEKKIPPNKIFSKDEVLKIIEKEEIKPVRDNLYTHIQKIDHSDDTFFEIDKRGLPIDLRDYFINEKYGEPYSSEQYIKKVHMLIKEVGDNKIFKTEMILTGTLAMPSYGIFLENMKVYKFRAYVFEGKLLPFSDMEFTEVDIDPKEIFGDRLEYYKKKTKQLKTKRKEEKILRDLVEYIDDILSIGNFNNEEEIINEVKKEIEKIIKKNIKFEIDRGMWVIKEKYYQKGYK